MTNAGIFRQRAKGTIFVFALLATPMAATAQDRPGPAAELAAGWVGFADDGIVSESLVGGAAQWYLLPRVSETRKHFFDGTYTSSEGAFTAAGGGVRAFVGDRVTVGLELRLGWEPHIRISGLVGLQLGR